MPIFHIRQLYKNWPDESFGISILLVTAAYLTKVKN